jgi:uncharacterized small protein (DUF1192 family)
MRDDDPFAKPEPKTVPLERWSIAELEEHIDTLRAEIERCAALIASKKASRAAADSVFGGKAS